MLANARAPLLKWILSLWQSEEKWLPLAIDATNIGQNFTVLSLHILYQGCGIPVAWKIVKGTEKGSWKPHWLHIFHYVKDVVPDYWQVIVLADRGLYGDWLFEAICSLNWHPFLRINHQGNYQLRCDQKWRHLDTVAPRVGTSWSGYVTCFKNHSLECTLLARWDEGYKEPWLIVTDLEPTQAQSFWYGLRAWIESSYRDLKSDGWQWQKTRLREPARAERIWLAMAIATLWTVTVGSEGQQHPSKQFNDQPNPNYRINSKSELRQQPRKMSCFLQGLINIIADLVCGKGIYLKGLFPRQFFSLNTS
jgi:hypothetical protein